MAGMMSGTGYAALGGGLHSAADAVRDFYKLNRQQELDAEEKRRFDEEQKIRTGQLATSQALAGLEGKKFEADENERGLNRFERSFERMAPDTPVDPAFGAMPAKYGADPSEYFKMGGVGEVPGTLPDEMIAPGGRNVQQAAGMVTRNPMTFAQQDTASRDTEKMALDRFLGVGGLDVANRNADANMVNAQNQGGYYRGLVSDRSADNTRSALNTQATAIKNSMDRIAKQEALARGKTIEEFLAQPGEVANAYQSALKANPQYVQHAKQLALVQRQLYKLSDPTVTDVTLDQYFPLNDIPMPTTQAGAAPVDPNSLAALTQALGKPQ